MVNAMDGWYGTYNVFSPFLHTFFDVIQTEKIYSQIIYILYIQRNVNFLTDKIFTFYYF